MNRQRTMNRLSFLIALVVGMFLLQQQTVLASSDDQEEVNIWTVEVEGSATIIRDNTAEARVNALRECFKSGIDLFIKELIPQTEETKLEPLWEDIDADLTRFAYAKEIIKEGRQGDVYALTVIVGVHEVEVALLLLKNDLLPKWRIMVVIPEQLVIPLPPPPDPAAETVIVAGLLDAGYILMDQIIALDLRYGRDREAAFQGDINAIRRIFDQCHADILVVGEAFAEVAPPIGNFVSCRARVEIKAIRRDSGEIISSIGKQGSGADLTMFVASKVALENAGKLVFEELLSDLLMFATDSNRKELIIKGCNSITLLASIEDQIRAIEGVLSLTRYEFETGTARLIVELELGLDDFELELDRIESPKLRVIHESPDSITAEVVPDS